MIGADRKRVQAAEIPQQSQEADLEQVFRVWPERQEFSCVGFGSVTLEQRRSKPVEYCRHISVALSNVASLVSYGK